MLCCADKMGKATLIKDRGLPEDISKALSKWILPAILTQFFLLALILDKGLLLNNECSSEGYSEHFF